MKSAISSTILSLSVISNEWLTTFIIIAFMEINQYQLYEYD